MGKVKKTSGNGSEKSPSETQKGEGKSGGVLGTSVAIKKKSKREKFAQKRKKLTQKLTSAASGSTAGKKKRRRKTKAKGAINVGSLKDALPSLESLIKLRSSKEIITGIPEYDSKSEPSKRFQKMSKKAQKTYRAAQDNTQHVARMTRLETLMQDKTFKQNPRHVIAEHVRNTRKMEEEMEDQ